MNFKDKKKAILKYKIISNIQGIYFNRISNLKTP